MPSLVPSYPSLHFFFVLETGVMRSSGKSPVPVGSSHTQQILCTEIQIQSEEIQRM